MDVLRDLFGPGTWGTGGNLIAWVICGAIGAGAAYTLRHKIGKRLAAWWDFHHGPKAEKRHLNALRARDEERRQTVARSMAALREQQADERNRGTP